MIYYLVRHISKFCAYGCLLIGGKIQLIETKNFLMYIETLLLSCFFTFQITRSMTFFFYPSDLCMFIEKVVKLVDPYQGFFFHFEIMRKKNWWLENDNPLHPYGSHDLKSTYTPKHSITANTFPKD